MGYLLGSCENHEVGGLEQLLMRRRLAILAVQTKISCSWPYVDVCKKTELELDPSRPLLRQALEDHWVL